jgi:hypothetical protein
MSMGEMIYVLPALSATSILESARGRPSRSRDDLYYRESLEQPAQSKVSMCIWEYASVCFSGLIEWTDFLENRFTVVNVGIPPDTRQVDLQGRSETQFGNQARRYERKSPGTHKGGSKSRVSLL